MQEEDFEMQALVYKQGRDTCQELLEAKKAELVEVVQHLEESNSERHRYEDLFSEKCKEYDKLLKEKHRLEF